MKDFIVNIVTFVLDDHPLVLTVIDNEFKKAGIDNYRLFDNPEQFLSQMNENVHIAVIDYLLGDSAMNGVEVCKKLLEKNPRCYIIIMSGQVSIDVVIDMLNAGAKKYVAKWKKNYESEVVEFVRTGIKTIERDLEYYGILLQKLSTLNEDKNDGAAIGHNRNAD